METEETNTTEAPEIHCKEFQIESGNTEEGNHEIASPSMRMRGGLFSPRLFLVGRNLNKVKNKAFLD